VQVWFHHFAPKLLDHADERDVARKGGESKSGTGGVLNELDPAIFKIKPKHSASVVA
jgi:hypothetical protein